MTTRKKPPRFPFKDHRTLEQIYNSDAFLTEGSYEDVTGETMELSLRNTQLIVSLGDLLKKFDEYRAGGKRTTFSYDEEARRIITFILENSSGKLTNKG